MIRREGKGEEAFDMYCEKLTNEISFHICLELLHVYTWCKNLKREFCSFLVTTDT